MGGLVNLPGALMVVAAVVASFAVGTWSGVAYVGTRINGTNVFICSRVNALDDALVSILDRSLNSLPSNPYYHQHPDQLQQALKATALAIDKLTSARC
ncbi:MAG: hypothetical protein ACREP9_05050 [Candidatus Dormibacteraceae bacterium]